MIKILPKEIPFKFKYKYNKKLDKIIVLESAKVEDVGGRI
jgi:hypothetical protein